MYTKSKLGWLAITALALITGCASTGPSDPKVWRDPNYTGPPFTKILVIGLSSKGLADRQGFEDLLVAQIKAVGALAAPGYQYIPTGPSDQATVMGAIGRSGADALLIAHITGFKNRDDILWDPDFGFDYGWGMYDGFYSDPVVFQYRVATVYTTLYDAKNMRPVWTYSPKTMDPDTLQQQAPPYASTVVGLMQSNGLLGTYIPPK
jgi:hypothetical protein